MKQNIEIEVPDGFEAKYDSSLQKIEFVKSLPKTWEEYCKTNLVRQGEAYINPSGSVALHNPNSFNEFERKRKNWCLSYEEAEAFVALMQLRQLHRAWIGEWKPDYSKSTYGAYSIRRYNGNKDFCVLDENINGILVFPTSDMAKEFIKCFNDLLNTAKVFI